jgi:hypothetical protein
MNNLNESEIELILRSLSFEQANALYAFVNLIANKKHANMSLTYYGSTSLQLFSEDNLLEAKKVLNAAGMAIQKLSKQSSGTSQWASGDVDVKGGNIHVSVYPKSDTFTGCKLVEIEVPEEVPAHIVEAQPAREAIPAHTVPKQIVMKKKKIVQCGW